MADLALPWKGDLSLTPDGDLALIDGIPLDNQHIVRGLFTAVRGYLFHPTYGAGLIQRIGRVALDRNIRAIVRAQLALDPVVARVPVPVVEIDFTADDNGACFIGITYTNAVSNLSTEIALEVPLG